MRTVRLFERQNMNYFTRVDVDTVLNVRTRLLAVNHGHVLPERRIHGLLVSAHRCSMHVGSSSDEGEVLSKDSIHDMIGRVHRALIKLLPIVRARGRMDHSRSKKVRVAPLSAAARCSVSHLSCAE